MQNNVIIVAGGKGLRMGNELPKQFIPIGGKPILMHTIEAFFNFDRKIRIILVLHPSYIQYWQMLCKEYLFEIPCLITEGGDTRFHSVKNGLALVDNGLVAVHDAARPFVSNELISNCFLQAMEHKAVIPVTDATDSLRQIISANKSQIIDRSTIKLVQTPQVFCAETLTSAYKCQYTDTFTDDASVVEASGVNIHLVKGEYSNIKITNPFDLEIAEIIFKNKN